MKNSKLNTPITKVALGAVLCAALVACGGGNSSASGSPSTSTSTTTGVAAIGSAIVGGTVSFTCASGATASATTGSDGTYSARLKTADYPCVVQVAGGQANGIALASSLHSVAASPGTTNVTPLTDLIVGVLGNGNASALDGAASGVLSSAITAGNLSSALAKVQAAIATLPGSLTLANGFNPLNSQFSVGDANDALLDQYATALQAAGLSQQDAATKAASGSALTQKTYSATAYTTPGFTAMTMGASVNLDGTFGISLDDPNRGSFSAQARIDSTGEATSFVNAGKFSGIVSQLGNRIGELCTGNTAATQLTQYAYASGELTAVTDPAELNGKTFVEYENCGLSGTTTVDSSGTYTFREAGSNQSDPGMPNFFSHAFTSSGYIDGNGSNTATVRANAYKYLDQNGHTTYVYVEVSSKTGSTQAIIDGNSNFVLIGVQQQPI